MADAPKDVAAPSTGLDAETKASLRDLAASLSHGYSVITALLGASGDIEPLPESVFRDFVPPSERWYAMFTGTNPGVYQGIENVPNRFQSRANTVRYKTEASARHAFRQALAANKVIAIVNGNEKVLIDDDVVNDTYST